MSVEPPAGRALVTGAASGIGLTVARRLVQAGARVALVDRSRDQLEEAAAQLGAVAISADLSVESAVNGAFEQTLDRLGGAPSLLVHAAGIYRIGPLAGLDAATWDETLAVNLRSAMLIGRAAAEALHGDAGSFVFISSMAARLADRSEPSAHYNASKAGVLALVRQMAAEWGPAIRVNAVSPGVIRTPMLRITDNPAAARAYLSSRVPLDRLGEADEVAAAIVFLLSGEASYITGIDLPVDGGATIT